MPGIGRWMVVAGLFLVAIGGLFWIGERLFGRSGGLLPGDIIIRKGNFTFAFPIVTSIVLSVLVTLLLRLFGGQR